MRCFTQILSMVMLILLVGLDSDAQSSTEVFDKSYKYFKDTKTLMLNATLKTYGKRAGKTVDLDGRFGMRKKGLELEKFRHTCVMDVTSVNMVFFEEAVFNGDTFYSYNFEKRCYENKGKLYAQFQGKRKTRTAIFFYSDLAELFQEFENKKSSIVYSIDSIGYNLRIPSNREKGSAIMYFERDRQLPYKTIEYDEPGNGDNYTMLAMTNIRTGLPFPDHYFETPNAEGAVEHKDTTTPSPMFLQDDKKDLLPIGAMAPEWQATTPGGAEIKSSAYQGKVMVVDFWASWCGPCVKAMPALQLIHEKYKDVTVLGFDEGENTVDLDDYKVKKNLSYTLLPSTTKISKDFKVSSLPTIYVIDKYGKIIYAAIGYGEEDSDALIAVVEMAIK